MQAALKLEAAASYVEEALKSKEAVEAENAAAAAKAAEDEAAVGGGHVNTAGIVVAVGVVSGECGGNCRKIVELEAAAGRTGEVGKACVTKPW